MILLFKMGFRNLLRHKRRTTLTLLTMVAGFVLSSFAISMADGSYGQMIELLTESNSGHLQLHKSGYLEKPSIYKTITNPGDVARFLSQQNEVIGFSKRIHSYVLGFSDVKSSGVKFVGVDPQLEAEFFKLKNKISQGEFFNQKDPGNQALLGFSAARILKVRPGDDVFLISQGIDGSIANDQFKIIGILGSDDSGYDTMSLVTPLKVAQQFLSMGTQIHEVAVILKDLTQSIELSARMTENYGEKNDLEVVAWEKVEEDFYKSMTADKQGNWISLVIIMVVVAVGCLNSFLMATLERMKEFGVLRALGTRPYRVFGLIVVEAFLVALVAVSVGSLISFFLNGFFSIHGISMEKPIDVGGIKFEEIKCTLSFGSFYIPALMIFISTLVVSIMPANYAAKKTPVESLRSV